MQLGWVYFRADTGRALHCRLGGDPATVGGESVILGTEDNVSTVAMFTGRSAPPAAAPVASRTPPAAASAIAAGRAGQSDFLASALFASVVAAGASFFPEPSEKTTLRRPCRWSSASRARSRSRRTPSP